ncbi:secreted protein [gut metagenome]|uniref:Secreted protein n=1 Tax=gut metagenome TaxID=749906 RepID=J9GE75_9ZZZZ
MAITMAMASMANTMVMASVTAMAMATGNTKIKKYNN